MKAIATVMLLVVLLLNSCVSSPPKSTKPTRPIKCYHGPVLLPQQVAELVLEGGFVSFYIDGKAASRSTHYDSSSVRYGYAIAPGRHVILLTYAGRYRRSKEPLPFPIVAEAGRRYLIYADLNVKVFGEDTAKPILKDITDDPGLGGHWDWSSPANVWENTDKDDWR